MYIFLRYPLFISSHWLHTLQSSRNKDYLTKTVVGHKHNFQPDLQSIHFYRHRILGDQVISLLHMINNRNLWVHHMWSILNCIFGRLCFQHFYHHNNQVRGIHISQLVSGFFWFVGKNYHKIDIYLSSMSYNHIGKVCMYQKLNPGNV